MDTKNAKHVEHNAEMSLKKVAEHLKKYPQAKVIFMVGAGISTACGIPDFRSPKTGLYHNLSKLDLPYAEAVFDIAYFKENPKPFYILAKELYPGNFKPTKFHYLMKLFEQNNRLRRIYTQNIDTLERQALIDDKLLIEAHGSFASNHCIECDKEFSVDAFREKLDFKRKCTSSTEKDTSSTENNLDINYASCDVCEGLIKPRIVFFGEGLPSMFFDTWDEDLAWLNTEKDEKNLVIVAGTSLTVYPFASLPSEVPKCTPRALFNIGLVGDFESNPRKSDLVFNGGSEDAAQCLANELGWSKNLEKLMKEDKAEEEPEKTASEEVTKVIEDLQQLDLGTSKDSGK